PPVNGAVSRLNSSPPPTGETSKTLVDAIERPPTARRLPSGENETSATPPARASPVRRKSSHNVEPSKRHTRAVPSTLPEASRPSSNDQSIDGIGPPCPD